MLEPIVHFVNGRSTCCLLFAAMGIVVVPATSSAYTVRAATELAIPKYPSYYSNDASCESTHSPSVVHGLWVGQRWSFIAPQEIQTPEDERRRFGTGLNVRPLQVLIAEALSIGVFTDDTDEVGKEEAATLRLVLVVHGSHGQESGHTDRVVRAVVRLCVKHNSEWRSVLFDTVRAVRGRNGWRRRSREDDEADFSEAFRRAVHVALVWARADMGGRMESGSLVEDTYVDAEYWR